MAKQDELQDTAPQKAMTNYDVFLALSSRHDQSDLLASTRHLALVTEIESIKGELRKHDERIARVEHGRFPVGPLWTLVVIAAMFAIASTSIAWVHHTAWLNTHVSAAHT